MEEGRVDALKVTPTILTAYNRWYKEKSFMGISVKDPKEIKVYRCKSCGFLESYAK